MDGHHTLRVDALEAVERQLRHRYLSLKRRGIGGDILLAAVGIALLATMVVKLAGWPVPLLWLYGAIFILALCVWAIWSWRLRVSPLSVLIAADQTLALHERLSTAYEYLRHVPDHPFMPGLVMQAEQAARRVEPRTVFPARFPRRLWGIPLFLAVLVGLTYLDVKPLTFDELAQEDVAEEVAREGKRLESWGRRLEQLAEQESLDRSLILARHIQQLGRRLQSEGGEGPQAAERISTLSQYLQRMQQELRERALMSDSGEMAVQDVMASGKSLRQELQDILQMLRGDTLPSEMKNVAEQGVQRLGHQLGKSAEMAQLMQNLETGNVAAARQLLQDLIQQQEAAEEMEHLDRAQKALQYASRSLEKGQPRNKAPSQSPQPQGYDPMEGGVPYDFLGDEMMSEDMPNMDDLGSAGAGEEHGFSRHSASNPGEKRLQESRQPVSQVPVQSGEGQTRLGYMRYLPLQNEAKVPLEQAVVQYQRAAESVLAQERIPRGYRDQIKEYFLAIGMTAQEKPE